MILPFQGTGGARRFRRRGLPRFHRGGEERGASYRRGDAAGRYRRGGGLYALRNNVRRLAEDHENAKELARALAELPGIELINSPVMTNIIQFRWKMPTLSLPLFQEALGEKGVLIDDRAFPVFRAVTHLGIGKKEVARVIRALRQVFGRAAA